MSGWLRKQDYFARCAHRVGRRSNSDDEGVRMRLPLFPLRFARVLGPFFRVWGKMSILEDLARAGMGILLRGFRLLGLEAKSRFRV